MKEEVVRPVEIAVEEPIAPKPLRRRRRITTGVGISLAAVLVLGILMAQGVYIKPLQINSLGIINTSFTLPDAPAPETRTNAHVALKSGTHPAPVMMPETDLTRTHDAAMEIGYYLVLGSFNQKEKAERYIKQQNLDNDLLIIDNGVAQFRVATYVTTNTTQALASLDHFKHNFRPDVWLLYNSY